jgi:hypothetical protein
MHSKSSIIARIGLGLALILPLAFQEATPEAQAGLNPLKSRLAAIKHVAKLAARTAKVRQLCANAIEQELRPWSDDCAADPVPLGGTGSGNAEVDEDLTKVLGTPLKRYLRLRLKGLPSVHGLSNACGVEADDWGSTRRLSLPVRQRRLQRTAGTEFLRLRAVGGRH